MSHVSNAWTWWMTLLVPHDFCSGMLCLPLAPLVGKWLLLVTNSNQSKLPKLAEALTPRAQELDVCLAEASWFLTWLGWSVLVYSPVLETKLEKLSSVLLARCATAVFWPWE